MKNLIIIITLAATCFWASCSKSYLDTKPTGSVNKENVFTNTEDAKRAVNGLCKLMTTQYFESQGFNGEGTIKMYYGNYPGNNFSFNLPAAYNITNGNYLQATTNLYNYYPWYYYYTIIANANSIIIKIDQAEGVDADKAYIKAQALTFRAYAYMMLTQLYSNRWSESNNGAAAGVVLRLDESTGNMPLSTMKRVYAQVYKDLDSSIVLYTAASAAGVKRPVGDNYSPDINVAYATYSRAALNKKDYPLAASYAVKARVGYPLMNTTAYKAGFNTPTPEWIWSSVGRSEENLDYYSYHAYIGYDANGTQVRSYPKCISKELFNKIPVTDIRRGLFFEPKAGDSYYADGSAGSAATANRARQLYPGLTSLHTIYMYMQAKIKVADQVGVGHLNHFRSSEMILNEAEAEYFLTNETAAQNLLIELNKTSGRDPSYTCTKTGAALLTEIKTYRAIELWAEGFDWFDMKRWGDPIVRKPYSTGNFIADFAVTIQPSANNNWTWKLPRNETDYNKAIGQPLLDN